VSYGYLTIADVLDVIDTSRAGTSIIVAGNGMGKTYTSRQILELAVRSGGFEIAYYSSSSHDNMRKVIDYLKSRVIVVYHMGFTKFCPNRELVQKIASLGIPPFMACKFCPLFQHHYRATYKYIQEYLKHREFGLLRPIAGQVRFLGDSEGKVCTYPLIKKIAFDPIFLYRLAEYRLKPTVIVTPSSTFLTHNVRLNAERVRERQRRERRALMIVDEVDNFLLDPIEVHVEPIELGESDKELLLRLGTMEGDVAEVVELNNKVYEILKRFYKDVTLSPKHAYLEIKELVQSNASKITLAYRSLDEISWIMYMNEIKSIIPKVIMSMYSLLTAIDIPDLIYFTRHEDRRLILEDYSTQLHLIYDPEYPYRSFTKICLTATLPDYSRVVDLSLDSRILNKILTARTIVKTYQNVYVMREDIRGAEGQGVMHFYHFMQNADVISSRPASHIKLYRSVFKANPRGELVWVQSKKMFAIMYRVCKVKYGAEKLAKNLFIYRIPVRDRLYDVYVSYVGSSISRGVDMDFLDISWLVYTPYIAMRETLPYSDIDYIKTITQSVQAIMRVVRSPRPKMPKLVIVPPDLERLMKRYNTPEWFFDLPHIDEYFLTTF